MKPHLLPTSATYFIGRTKYSTPFPTDSDWSHLLYSNHVEEEAPVVDDALHIRFSLPVSPFDL